MILAFDTYNLRSAFDNASVLDPDALAYEIESVFLRYGDSTYRACVTLLAASGDMEYLKAVRGLVSNYSPWWDYRLYPNNLFMLQHMLNLLCADSPPKDNYVECINIPVAWVKNDARLIIEANKNYSESLEIAMLYHLIILSLQKLTEKAA